MNIEEIKEQLNNNTRIWWEWNYDTVIGNKFIGVDTEKNPVDAWRYQEIIFEKRPDLIIETGSYKGGSALYLATICDLVNNGRVVSVDIRDNGQKNVKHPRLEFFIDDSTDWDINIRDEDKNVMVILDSNHLPTHVSLELDKFHNYVTHGQYLIIEDTIISDSIKVVNEFLKKCNDFERAKEPLFTSNFGGYLIRK